jgi:hypothetical protein
MKQIFIIFLPLVLLACARPTNNTSMQNRIDSLERKLEDTYKPGFGEFMSSIQAHHAKLWFAGENQNWRLADFEIHEMIEAIDDVQKYETERDESKLIGMINPAIDSVTSAIRKEDPASFKRSYVLLTNTCNNCHRSADFEFNVVKIPDVQSFSNQDFRVPK